MPLASAHTKRHGRGTHWCHITQRTRNEDGHQDKKRHLTQERNPPPKAPAQLALVPANYTSSRNNVQIAQNAANGPTKTQAKLYHAPIRNMTHMPGRTYALRDVVERLG